jgi:hypothetical protein
MHDGLQVIHLEAVGVVVAVEHRDEPSCIPSGYAKSEGWEAVATCNRRPSCRHRCLKWYVNRIPIIPSALDVLRLNCKTAMRRDRGVASLLNPRNNIMNAGISKRTSMAKNMRNIRAIVIMHIMCNPLNWW